MPVPGLPAVHSRRIRDPSWGGHRLRLRLIHGLDEHTVPAVDLAAATVALAAAALALAAAALAAATLAPGLERDGGPKKALRPSVC